MKRNIIGIRIIHSFAMACAITTMPVFSENTELPVDQLLIDFKTNDVFWSQFEVAEKIIALHDPSILTELEGWLEHENRHIRGNTAFIFASLGDDRGFKVIQAILTDRSDRPFAQDDAAGFSDGNYQHQLQEQIKSDRYYAVHLLGDLKDPRAIPILIPLLADEDVNYIVPWALGEIGDKRAIEPLINTLDDKNASLRVLAIYALVQLEATEAIPRLHELLSDNERTDFGELVSVAEAARDAITRLEKSPQQGGPGYPPQGVGSPDP